MGSLTIPTKKDINILSSEINSSSEINQVRDGRDASQILLETSQTEGSIELKGKPQHFDDVLSSFKVGQFHWRILVLVGGGYFAVCSEMMLFIFLSSPLKKQWDLEELEFSWLPFSTGIAGIIGGYLSGTLSDKYGRRLPFLVGMVIIALFGVASAFAPTYPVFITFRCLVTIGTGTFEAVGFVLLLEFLPRQRRGPLLVVVTLCGAMGAVLAGGFAWLILPGLGWRWFVAVCAGPAVLLLGYLPFAFHESPRFLFISGRKEKALKVLESMASMNKCKLPDLSNVVCPPENQPRGQVLRLFGRELRARTVTFSVIWFLQATGYWGVTVYLPEYMSRLGVDPYFNMFSVFIGEIPGMFLAMFLIERYMLGRIRTLRFFSGATALFLLIFSFIPKHAFKSAVIIVCYCSMVPIYSILNTFTPEVYPTDIRSTAMAWMNILIELPGLLTPFVGATLLSSDIPWLYPVVWGCVFVLQFVVTFALKIETADQDLKDYQYEENLASEPAPVQHVVNC